MLQPYVLTVPKTLPLFFYDSTVEFSGNKLGINWLKEYRTSK
jgi:hypothetical protein